MWPAWSPRGDEIAYESYRGEGAEIFAVSVENGRERRLTPVDLDAREPSWSPDGSEIAFLSSTPAGWALVIMSADGGRLRKLVEGKGLRNPSWSPDGQWIVFAWQPEGAANEDVCAVDAASGSRMVNLTNDGGGFDWEPSWTR
jgi:TolB protein